MHPPSTLQFEVKGHLSAILIEISLISTIFQIFLNRESLKNENDDWLIWNYMYLLKYFAWRSTVIAWFYLLKMVSKRPARLLYVWKYVSAIQLCCC